MQDTSTEDYVTETSVEINNSTDALFVLPESVVWVLVTIVLVEIIAGVIGNCVVCLTVYKNKSLRTPMNGLIVNLCAADILVSLVASPVAIYLLQDTSIFSEASEVYRIQSTVCQFLLACHLLVGIVVIVTLACISIERYHAIAKPFDKGNRWKRIKICIVFSWFFGVAVTTAGLLMPSAKSLSPMTTHHLLIQTFVAEFVKFVYVPFTFMCVLVIVSLYIAIVYLIQKHAADSDKKLSGNKVKKSKIVPTTEEDKRSDAKNSTMLVGIQQLGSEFVVLPKKKKNGGENINNSSNNHAVEAGETKPNAEKSNVITKETTQELNPQQEVVTLETNVSVPSQKVAENATEGEAVCVRVSNVTATQTDINDTTEQKAYGEVACIRPRPENGETPVIEICDRNGEIVKATTTRSEVVGNICVMNNSNKERGKRKVEARSAKVTAVVMVAFLACWLPLPAVLIKTARYAPDDLHFKHTDKILVFISLCISFLSAALNPVVYGLVNRQIRNGIVRLAKKYKSNGCPCKSKKL